MAAQLQHSDVVLSWGGLNPDACRKYGVTVWGWGPYYNSKQVAEGFGLGFRIVASLVNLNIREPHTTEVGRDLLYNPKLRASTCVDIAGQPIVVPWWAREYGDDNRAYWHCTNNRWYREHLKRVVRSGVLAGGNAIHIDDAMSNNMVLRLPQTGGCFCDACMNGFRTALERRHSREELVRLGIENIETFDYRDMVRPVAATRAEFAERYARGEVPLQGEFRLFLTEEAARFLGELVRCAKETAGENIPVSANLGVMRPDVLLGAAYPDYFVIELHYLRPTGDFPLQPLKLAQAFGKKCATWPVGYNVDRVRRENLTGMLKLWVATTYALGHNFMITDHMWCSTSATGMVFYDAPEEELLPLYHFVRDQAGLLDGFEEAPQFGLLYSNADARSERPVTERTGWEMFDRNLSYRLLLAGDDYLASRLNAASADNCVLVVVPDAHLVAGLDEKQRQVVEGWLASGKAAYWDDIRERDLDPDVRLAAGTKIWVIVRQRQVATGRELVIHLIDHDYDPATNTFGPPKQVRLELDPRILGGKAPPIAALHALAGGPVAVSVETVAGRLHVATTMTGFWNILHFSIVAGHE